MRTLLVLSVIGFLLPSTTWAQEPATGPAVQDPDTYEHVTRAPAAEAADAQKDEETKDAKDALPSKSHWGLGASGVFWEKGDDPDFPQPSLGVTLYRRSVTPVNDFFGVQTLMTITFHDWEAMGDAYDWYFEEPEDPEESTKGLKLLFLWPGFILIPFGGANYNLGGGITFYTSATAPSLYFDMGVLMGLLLRPSDSDFIADMGFGGYGGIGFDLAKNFGINARIEYQKPLFRWLADSNDAPVITGTFSLAFITGE